MSLLLLAQLTLAFAFGIIISTVVFILLKKHAGQISTLEAEACNGHTAKTAIEEFRKSREFRMIKKDEYNKGFREGTDNAINDFQIQYQKFENVDEKFFSSIVETGYFMQLTYRGLPVGEVTKRVIHAGKKVDKKRVDGIINKLNETVTLLVQAAALKKIPIKEVKNLLSKNKS